ncbi:MAG: hypothetical protein ACI8RZ_007936 [Myxococcota bacterium]|jgi:hypothetical protein
MGDRLEVDGAVRDFAPVRAAIDAGASNITARLTERGDQLSRVTAWEVRTSFRVTQRLLRIMFHEIIHNDLHQCERINSLLDRGLLQEETSGYRRINLTVIQPSVPLAGPLEFGEGLIDAQIKQVYEDARMTVGA